MSKKPKIIGIIGVFVFVTTIAILAFLLYVQYFLQDNTL